MKSNKTVTDPSVFERIATRAHTLNGMEREFNVSTLFCDFHSSYINEFTFYMHHFGLIPNVVQLHSIDCTQANLWFVDNFDGYIKDWFYDRYGYSNYRKVVYILQEDLMLCFDMGNQSFNLLFRNTKISLVNHFLDKLNKFKCQVTSKPKIWLLVNSSDGLYTKSITLSKKRFNIIDNYNEDFADVHKVICKRLSKKGDKGLVMLFGKPGTGKTSYIRHLAARVKKKVIFLPLSIAGEITNPNLISILIDNPDSILIIEDAENIIIDREVYGMSPVSALLNISDGLLSDCLNIQIICTFNTDISKVDKALLRKGRLIAMYEFKELEIQKAQSLSNKLGFDSIIGTPTTLSDIYNGGERDYQQPKRANIGFMNHANLPHLTNQ